MFVAGASLIAPGVAMTGAHKVQQYTGSWGELVVRCGEWDTQTESEPLKHQDRCFTIEIQTKAFRRFVIMEKAPTRAFSWLKAATTAFTFNALLRHYAKRALTPRSLNVKLGPRRKGHKGRAVWLA